jgi:hypothetical protein
MVHKVTEKNKLEFNCKWCFPKTRILVQETFLVLFFWWDWGLNSGLQACKAGALLLKSHHQSRKSFKYQNLSGSWEGFKRRTEQFICEICLGEVQIGHWAPDFFFFHSAHNSPKRACCQNVGTPV